MNTFTQLTAQEDTFTLFLKFTVCPLLSHLLSSSHDFHYNFTKCGYFQTTYWSVFQISNPLNKILTIIFNCDLLFHSLYFRESSMLLYRAIVHFIDIWYSTEWLVLDLSNLFLIGPCTVFIIWHLLTFSHMSW